MQPIILIPARLAATRLPNKPLADLGGKPLIYRVWERAIQSGFEHVWVAAGDEEIVKIIHDFGGKAILTDPALPSGSDRIQAALDQIDPKGQFDIAINFQGDLPYYDPQIIAQALRPLEIYPDCDIATLGRFIDEESDRDNPNCVKIAYEFMANSDIGKALYFSRTAIPFGSGPLIQHFGVYAYRRHVLDSFPDLPATEIEKRENLEQLRALTAGYKFYFSLIRDRLLEVNTPEDLERMKGYFSC